MKNTVLYVAVGISVLLSIVAITASRFQSPPPDVIPDDADITRLHVTVYPLGPLGMLDPAVHARQPPAIEDFVVPPEHIPKIMHFFRPPKATRIGYSLDSPIAVLTIDTKARYPTLRVKCYWAGGKGPVLFTSDDKTFFCGNLWCAADGGLGVRVAIMEAFMESNEKGKE